MLKVDNNYLKKFHEKSRNLYCERNSEKVIIKKEAFLEHEAILTRIIRKCTIAFLLGSTYNFERKHIIDIIDFKRIILVC